MSRSRREGPDQEALISILALGEDVVSATTGVWLLCVVSCMYVAGGSTVVLRAECCLRVLRQCHVHLGFAWAL